MFTALLPFHFVGIILYFTIMERHGMEAKAEKTKTQAIHKYTKTEILAKKYKNKKIFLKQSSVKILLIDVIKCWKTQSVEDFIR